MKLKPDTISELKILNNNDKIELSMFLLGDLSIVKRSETFIQLYYKSSNELEKLLEQERSEAK